jgi:hypothetical protein
MSIWGRFACLIAGAALVAGSLVATAAPADAACTIAITGPKKWVIDGTDSRYRYTGNPSCDEIDSWDASANLYGPNSTYRDFDFIWVGNGYRSQRILVDDYTKPGAYVFGSKDFAAWDQDYDRVRVSGMPTPTVRAKYASRARVSGTRSGSRVRLTGTIKRYCGSCIRGYDEGYTKRSGKVLLQRKRYDDGRWSTFKTLRKVDGRWSHTARFANRQYFRAVVTEIGHSWSASSNKVRR